MLATETRERGVFQILKLRAKYKGGNVSAVGCLGSWSGPLSLKRPELEGKQREILWKV